MNHEELIQLLARIRPNGIEPEAYEDIVNIIISYLRLELTKDGG